MRKIDLWLLFCAIFASTRIAAQTQNSCAEGNPSAQMERAQQFYALRQWSAAAKTFEQTCPCLPAVQQLRCQIWVLRAMAQDSASLQTAVQKLDTLLVRSEPEQDGYGELLLTASSLYLRQQKSLEAWKAWRLARQTGMQGQEETMRALCDEIRVQIRDTTLVADCNRVPPLSKTLAQSLSSSANRPLSSALAVKPPAADSPQSAVNPLPASDNSWVLQFGAFGNKENAELLLQNLRKRKIPARLVTKNAADRVLWLVQTEAFPSKEAALHYGQTTLSPLQLDFQALPAP